MSSERQQREAFLKTCLLKDLRVECRNRGINPAGSRDTLVEKLNTAMTTNNETSFSRLGVSERQPQALGHSANNYSRPEGQNVGNFLTDRKSSRVSAPPGGKSSVTFMGGTAASDVVEDKSRRSTSPPTAAETPIVPEKAETAAASPIVPEKAETAAPSPPERPVEAKPEQEGLSLSDNEYAKAAEPVGVRGGSNNYSRPGNRQNVGNYITGRNTSRVLAPPGGGSNITFG